ncbi:HYR domain-containing protein [Hymenobacter sp. YC55]|uniref:HYR domain-containing protein n=1 Tax=Hymenobacter sp. YC55 TaxID=3034019 RepID=UPI0023F96F39|nr:HYR domain-containing protein [Hymenobacter sp. YC55]MDF7813550.1 HYR domain-containing protein [Hymenobacter sp. YC55]
MHQNFTRLLLLIGCLLTLLPRSYGQQLTTPTVTLSSSCAGGNITVSFAASGSFGNGTKFVTQLSNNSGSFTSPTELSVVNGAAGPYAIATSLPTTLVSGTGYLIRVVTRMGNTTGATTSPNSVPLTFNALPTATLSGTSSICSGGSATLSVALTGKAPWSVTYTNGTTQQTINNISTSSYTFTVRPTASSTTYSLTSVSDAGCTGTVTGTATITVRATPTATLSGGGPVCLGGSATLRVALTGTAPWSVTYTNGTTLTTVTDITASPVSLPVRPTATSTYSLTAVSDANCPGTGSGTATVTINTPPVVTVPANISVGNDANQCGASVSFAATATGAPTPGVVYSVNGAVITSPYVFPIGTTAVTARATNSCGTDEKTFTVQVTDTQRPAIVAPAAVVLSADAGSCGRLLSTASLGTATATDNCAGVLISNDAPTSFPLGATTVTWTATDAAGLTATATQVVTVTDNQNPTITAPAAVAVTTDAGACAATGVNLGNPVTADNCSVASVSSDAPTSFPLGSTTVVWTVTDGSGNTATASQTVTVTDTQKPAITAPAAVTGSTDSNSCEATRVSLGTPVTADNCTVASVGSNAPASFPIGTTTVVWTVTDGSGNTATASQIVTVTDNQNPTITAPAAVAAFTDLNSCTASGVVLGTPVTADNCTVASITNNAPANFALGSTTVIWTVTDGAGNTATASQTVTITDNQAPTITAPAAKKLTVDAGACAATGVSLGVPVTADNCTVASVTSDAPTSFPLGSTTVTWTVTDAAGHTATATQTVTVTDNEKPTITAPAAVAVSADGNSCLATSVSLGTPVTADNCTVASVSNNAPVNFPLGATTVVWTVTDGSGNTATASQTVTVTDDQNPTITAPAAVAVTTDLNSCAATNVTLGSPVTADNCSVASVSSNAPGSFPLGSTIVTWTVRDGSGNVATATQTVTVTDKQKPTISAPVAVTKAADTDNCTAAIGAWLGTATAADNCTGLVVTNDAPATFPKGTTTVIWTATDGSGNTATASQTVTVVDTQKPVFSYKPANLAVGTDAGTCSATLTLVLPVATDNCTDATVSGVRSDNLALSAAFPKGTTTITWTATDAASNTTSYVQSITVTDNEAPVARTRPATVQLDGQGQASLSAAAINNGSSDNCGISSMTVSPSSFTCAQLGPQTVVLTVTDAQGNSHTASATVTVQDTQAPTITAPANISTVVDLNQTTATNVALGSAVALDNCSTSVSNNAPAAFPLGVTTVTWTATDAAGNKTTATQTVTVAKRPTALANLTRSAVQYSDTLTLKARLTDLATKTGLSGKTITFTVNGTAVGTASTNANGVALYTWTASSAPGSYTSQAAYAAGPEFLGSSAGSTFSVNKEDARVTYTGGLFASTASISSSTATVTLSATVRDITAMSATGGSANYDAAYDGFAGDIRNATVTFKVYDDVSAAPVATLPATLGLATPGDFKTGTATATWTPNIGTSDSKQYTVRVVVDGYYLRNSTADDPVVTISKPLNDFVTGGGYLVLAQSAGFKAGTAATKNNFGFNIKYNKSGKNLQGSVNILVRRFEQSDNTLHVYQVKGNVMQTLSVQPSTATTGQAVFGGKASIQDITNPLLPIPIGGNATLQLNMTDDGEPGSADQIGITVWDGSSNLWFASEWNGSQTVQKTLAGGNLVIRGGAFSTLATTTRTSSIEAETSTPLAVSGSAIQPLFEAYPNPFAEQTMLRFRSTESGRMKLQVYNAVGSLVTTVFDGPTSAGQQYTVPLNGRELPVGIYFCRLIGGGKVEQLRVVLSK